MLELKIKRKIKLSFPGSEVFTPWNYVERYYNDTFESDVLNFSALNFKLFLRLGGFIFSYFCGLMLVIIIINIL